MKRILFYAFISVAGAFFWSVLNERITVYVFLTGLCLALLVLFISEKYLVEIDYHSKFKLPSLLIFLYPFYLAYKIYTSGFKVLAKILSGSLNPKITSINTDIEDSLLVSIFANSITLTPGTISIDKKDNKLYVLYLDDKDKCILNPQKFIKCRYETILGGGKGKNE